MSDLLNALLHGAAYALAGGTLLVAAYYVLDLLTPGHLGKHLHGATADEAAQAGPFAGAASYSAALVTGTWLLSTALVVFTAIWTNGETSLGWALAWTVAFGVLGIILNSVMLLVIDAVTPGNLRQIVCTPGPVVPLAYVAAATALAVSGIVCASIA